MMLETSAESLPLDEGTFFFRALWTNLCIKTIVSSKFAPWRNPEKILFYFFGGKFMLFFVLNKICSQSSVSV